MVKKKKQKKIQKKKVKRKRRKKRAPSTISWKTCSHAEKSWLIKNYQKAKTSEDRKQLRLEFQRVENRRNIDARSFSMLVSWVGRKYKKEFHLYDIQDILKLRKSDVPKGMREPLAKLQKVFEASGKIDELGDETSEKKEHSYQLGVDGVQIFNITPHGREIEAEVKVDGQEFEFSVEAK